MHIYIYIYISTERNKVWLKHNVKAKVMFYGIFDAFFQEAHEKKYIKLHQCYNGKALEHKDFLWFGMHEYTGVFNLCLYKRIA